MLDCDHNGPFINLPGKAHLTAGACGKCGMEIHASYADLLRFAAIASDYADDMQTTISSEHGPRTQEARMQRRMVLRRRFVDAARDLKP